MTTLAYKVLTAEQWNALQADGFAGSPVDARDGYIHLSAAEQLTETVDKHFAQQSNLIIAAVDLQKLGGALRWETSRGGQSFPHLYGRLELRHVIAWCELQRDADGSVRLPRT